MTDNTAKVGDTVRCWVTGDLKKYDAVVTQVNDQGYPVRLHIDGWPMDLKPGDFILLGQDSDRSQA